jgi:alpha-L-fucosidase
MPRISPLPYRAAGVAVVFIALASWMPTTPGVPPPSPLLPIPTARQLAWQQAEMALFIHFGVNTFTDREWGDGTEDPQRFTPTDLDARQWARVARETGFKTVILTAKHHDGFCLWPSAYTAHSVASSPWRDGRGDVVRALADACRAHGLKLGLYLSPWDQHEPTYGEQVGYNQFYQAQLRELLTRYGPLAEVWFDGAKGENAKDMEYDFDAYRALVRQLQPDAVMFSDEGPDVRWIGNEHGFAGETNWSTLDPSKVSIGQHGIGGYLNTGEEGAPAWIPGECDVSIRPGWFWHPDQEPKSLDALLEIYFKSVGRNCVLLLNVPPDDRGLFADADVQRLYAFKAALDAIFDIDRALNKQATASNVRGDAAAFDARRALDHDLDTYWATDDAVTTGTLEVDLGAPTAFNVARIQEPVALGQRVQAYRLDVWDGQAWQTISRGTTVGHKKLDRFETVTAQRVRLVVEQARACPLIAEFGLHLDPR